MVKLSKAEEQKLIKSGRKWAYSTTTMPYRYAELFCEKCGVSLGLHDIVSTNLESMMYCCNCVQDYIKPVPAELPCGTVTEDLGDTVSLKYTSGSSYEEMTVLKTCYFNKKGRYIKVKGKRYYL